MGWIYLAASEESATHCETTLNPSPTVKLMHTVKEYSYQEWLNQLLPMLQFGTTLRPSNQKLLEGMSILFMGDFPARTLALQEMGKAWEESEADYFSRSCAWLRKSSPTSYSLKTFQPSNHAVDYKSLKKLPPWGMTADGLLFPLHPLEHVTDAKDGSYLPTPDASKRGARKNQNGHQYTLQDALGTGKINPQFIEWMMGYPIGWTEINLSVIPWFRLKQKKRSKS